MKLKISNLGIIESMEIDMSKPFVLFAGGNGTGKTYMASFLYSMVWSLGELFYREKNKNILLVTKTLKTGIDGELDADQMYYLLSNYFKSKKKVFIQSLNLNIQTESFNCEIVTSKEEWEKEILAKEFYIKLRVGSIRKKKDSFSYSIRWSKNGNEDLMKTMFLLSAYFDGVFGSYMFTAERGGIYTFSNELAQWRVRFPVIAADFTYPRPIADGVANAIDLVNFKNNHSKYDGFAEEIEKTIVHGSYSMTNDGKISFQTNDNHVLELNQISSTAKTLAPLVFYLRNKAGSNNLLIIDEPELNLHPVNQIFLARIFVKMMNAGIKLIISTHSDYIIREINNMIMADGLAKENDPIVEELGYDNGMLLPQDKFAPYIFDFNSNGKVTVQSLEVDKFGFNMPSIDEAINGQNANTETLYEILKYNYE